MRTNALALVFAGLALAACNGSQSGSIETPTPAVAQAQPQTDAKESSSPESTPVVASVFSGEWRGKWQSTRGARPGKLSIPEVNENNEFSGVYTYWGTPYQVTGTIQDNVLRFDIEGAYFEFTLQPDGHLEARRTVGGQAAGRGSFEKIS